MSRSRGAARQRLVAAAAALLLTGFHLGTTWLGIDYGQHWDEHFLQSLLADSVDELDAWPRNYFYGSLYAGMGYLALAPDWGAALPRLVAAAREVGQYGGRLEPNDEIRAIQAALRDRVWQPEFLIRVRMLFASAAALGVLWVYAAGSRLAQRPWGGVLAAGVLALSWEFNTHARHVAVDALLVMLVAGCFALLARYLEPSERESRPERWLYLAAALCGVATATKFHALLLLVSVIGVGIARAASPAHAALRAARCLALAAVATLAVNPGLLFDTVQVANDWGYTTRDYFRGSDLIADPYRALGPLHHLREATVYLAAAVLSPRAGLALVLSSVAALGFVARWRRDWRTTLAVGAFVPAYVLAISQAGLILVRNLLPVLPVLALFVMWGFEVLLLGGRRMRWLALALCAVWLGVNAVHITTTALSVRRPYPAERLVQDVREYVQRRPDERFLISNGLLALATKAGAPFRDLPNAQNDPRQPFDYFVYQPWEYSAQLPGDEKLGYFRRVFGSREVNYDYYPDWIGRGMDRRAYVIEEDKARRLFRELPR